MSDMTKATGAGRGSKPCPPNCTCAKHDKTRVINWDDPAARKAYNRQKANEKYASDPQFRERAREAQRRYRVKNPGRRRPRAQILGSMSANDLKYVYGITPSQIDAMLAAQDGCCYLCGEPLDLDNPRKVHLDHDHSCCRSGRSCGTCIRGLACNLCNQGIGAFGDDPDRMRRVADNLEMANRRLRSKQVQPQLGLFPPGDAGSTEMPGSNAPGGKDQ